jgi:hypothetical protein
MKKYIIQPGLVLLFLLVLGGTIYIVPILFEMLDKVAYKFVLLFLLFILVSNILAKIAYKYINLEP